ncbi:endonuclease [Spodoptera frugiperda granulovirus]|uniref:Endonuclease n=1 Tax=Spodoptera frugiperda granulovirus TaxID=307454 RepID=A0A0C5AS36_9BBAC|nr:endonuclease [Spodoptera frugiperda granulovirus]AJK91719.1 endonuclease [Spodoptera frugiperda granulovirus]AXS01080.1 endonuclease [Spodoptera frugiperda granulovirus]
MWELYMVRTPNGALYTGVSTDVARRFKTHCASRGARFLRNKHPLQLVYTSQCSMTHSQALSIEIKVKKWSKRRKELLILKQPSDPRDVDSRLL